MPVYIDTSLPAAKILEREGLLARAAKNNNRFGGLPRLRVAILNLMPTKEATELQLLRLLGRSPFNLEIELVRMASHQSKNTPKEYMERFYKSFPEIRERKYDGLIVTGAPVELLEFEEVGYWEELRSMMDWARTNVRSSLYICWGAQAALWHEFGIRKIKLDKKITGIFMHQNLKPEFPLMLGMDDVFPAPHSRYTGIDEAALSEKPGLEVLATAQEAGALILAKTDGSAVYITGHPEYSCETLDSEYKRDLAKGLAPSIPKNYYPDDDPDLPPKSSWRAQAQLLYNNWLQHFVMPSGVQPEPTLFIFGMGHVGRAVLQFLIDAQECELQEQPELKSRSFKLVGIADSSGAISKPEGFTAGELRSIIEGKSSGLRFSDAFYADYSAFHADAIEALSGLRPKLVAELSPTLLEAGSNSEKYALAAFSLGADLVFASKAALAVSWEKIHKAARDNGCRLRYSATVGAGMPVIDAGRAFARANPIQKIEAVLNGTSVYVLSLMEEGLSYDEAVRAAQKAGIAEADPGADLDGLDAAAKLCILARSVMGVPLDYKDVKRESLNAASPARLSAAKNAGNLLRAVGTVERDELPCSCYEGPLEDGGGSNPQGQRVRASISLKEVPAASPLARSGTENAVIFSSPRAGDIAITGRGAGPEETATAVLRDLILLA